MSEMTPFQREVREEVLNLMEAEGVSRAELARRMGVSRPLVSQWFNTHHNWSLETLERMGEALGYTFIISGWQIGVVDPPYQPGVTDASDSPLPTGGERG